MKKITIFFLLLLGYVPQFQSSDDDDDDINTENNEARKIVENEFKEEYCKMGTTGKCSPWTWTELENTTPEQLVNLCHDVAEKGFFGKPGKFVVETAKKVNDYQLILPSEENGPQMRNLQKPVVSLIALRCHVTREEESQIYFLIRHGYVLKSVKEEEYKESKLLFICSKLNPLHIKCETRSLLGFPTSEELMEQQKEAQRNYEFEFRRSYRESGHIGWMWPKLLQYSTQQKEKLCIAGARENHNTTVELRVSKAEAVVDFWLMYYFGEDRQEIWDLENLVYIQPLYCEVSTVDQNENSFLLIRGGYILEVLEERKAYQEVKRVYIKKKVSLQVDTDVKKMLEITENVTAQDKVPCHCCIQ